MQKYEMWSYLLFRVDIKIEITLFGRYSHFTFSAFKIESINDRLSSEHLTFVFHNRVQDMSCFEKNNPHSSSVFCWNWLYTSYCYLLWVTWKVN